MSNFEERFLLPASNLSRKQFLENELIKIRKQVDASDIPTSAKWNEPHNPLSVIELTERLDAIKDGGS